ncbi:MAG: hypothetical protein ACRDZ5_10820 [Acidimicrobiales bacterium]
MRFERTELFKSDYKRLSGYERELFDAALRSFDRACDRLGKPADLASWPQELGVKALLDAPGIFEMTWRPGRPGGSATWEWVSTIDADGKRLQAVRWRRLRGVAASREH